jgi:rhamnulokinase
MNRRAKFVAADLGASSGRVMVGLWDGTRLSLEELHRFHNGGVNSGRELRWDVPGIWAHIQEALKKYRVRFNDSPDGIGVDAWGVDFGLLDSSGQLVSNPFHYRDVRTLGVSQSLFKVIPESRIFAETGTQTMEINTLFQLYSMVQKNDEELQRADTLLMIPDLFHYFLCGEKAIEYTEATTTQMYSMARCDWVEPLLNAAGIARSLLPRIVAPASILGTIRTEVMRESGIEKTVPVVAVASHDTASAVVAIPNMDANSIFISSGTWSLIGVETGEPCISDDAFRLHFTNEGGPDGHVLLLKNITGLWILQECQRQWKMQGQHYEWTHIVKAASEAKALQSIFDPNDRRVQVESDMLGAIQSYCSETKQPVPQTIGEIARCAFQSLCLKYKSTIESLELLRARELKTIRIVGGGSLNTFLNQMTADACNRSVVAGPVEASALGNVMLQAIATGHLKDIHEARSAIAASMECVFYEPHPSEAWDEAFVKFKRLEVD